MFLLALFVMITFVYFDLNSVLTKLLLNYFFFVFLFKSLPLRAFLIVLFCFVLSEINGSFRGISFLFNFRFLWHFSRFSCMPLWTFPCQHLNETPIRCITVRTINWSPMELYVLWMGMIRNLYDQYSNVCMYFDLKNWWQYEWHSNWLLWLNYNSELKRNNENWHDGWFVVWWRQCIEGTGNFMRHIRTTQEQQNDFIFYMINGLKQQINFCINQLKNPKTWFYSFQTLTRELVSHRAHNAKRIHNEICSWNMNFCV